jgi:hypothetical protein
MVKIILTLSVVLLLLPTDLVAQKAPEINSGMMVRVSAPDVAEEKITGTVVSFDPEILVVKAKDQAAPWTIPVADIRQLEVSRGLKKGIGPLKGAGIGTLTGGGAGAAIGAIYWNYKNTGFGDDSGLYVIVGYSLLGAAAGLIGGIILGSSSKEHWETVSSDKFQIGLNPYPDGGKIVISYRFKGL